MRVLKTVLLLWLLGFSGCVFCLSLSWDYPTTRTDGAPFDVATEGEHYTLYCGDSNKGPFAPEVVISETLVRSWELLSRSYGYCYITITDTGGLESGRSTIAGKPAPPSGSSFFNH